MSVKTYDPKKVIITLGTHVVTGYAKDTFVKVGFIEDQVMSAAGASGETARALNADHRGAVELTLMQTSDTNDFLSALAIADRATGAGTLPLLIQDLRGTTLHAARNAWVKKPADSEFGMSVKDRPWALETDDLEQFVGSIAATP